MPLDMNHHCPVCGKKGNLRCLKQQHIMECLYHPGKFHSQYHECVACVAARAREIQRAKNGGGNGSTTGGSEASYKSNGSVAKAGKYTKPDNEKTMKQLRKEAREARKS